MEKRALAHLVTSQSCEWAPDGHAASAVDLALPEPDVFLTLLLAYTCPPF
jgi:hypothetical protein